MAETVADALRRQIVDGDLADGDLLPPQAVLVEHFNVSLVSLRDALRILETEGLLSVRRGNQGGAVVHAPAQTSAAYMLGLLLQSEHVSLADLGAALRDLEPTCAAIAARRPDRLESLVPELERLNTLMGEKFDDETLFTDLGRQFHDAVVKGCGNSTVRALVGTLESLWSSHEQLWAQRSAAAGQYPSTAERRAVMKTHRAMTDAITSGNAERAQRIAARHLADTQTYVLSGGGSERIIVTSSHPLDRATDWRAH